MFERKRWHRMTAILLVLTMLFTSIPAMAFAESTSEEPDAGEDVLNEETTLEDTLILEEGLSEDMIIEEESTETSTTFDLGDGRKTVIYHGHQVRYEDEEGNLTDYDPSLVSTETGTSTGGEDLTGYVYENKTGDMKQYIPENLNEDTPLLMENGDYAITMAPYQEKEKKEKVKKTKDECLAPYEKIEEKPVNAVYEGETVSYEYQSMNQGVKETLVLHEAPENNTFSYLVTAKGMDAELLESGVVSFANRKTGEQTAYIDKPFMNDATGEAYSEAIEVSMKKKAAGKYIVTYTLDEEYLNDKERVYPVSVDPTTTWKGDGEFTDTYIISGDYADVNFYDSDVRLMVAGKGLEGSYRTYFKMQNLKGTLDGYFVESAYITVYESGDCDPDQTIRFNRITENWSLSSITWNNKPTYNTTSINSFTTEGTQYAAHKVKVTNTVRNYINANDYSNYGIVMRNVTDSPEFAEFYGSRTSLTSYRPKLVVTYSDKPTAPSSVTVSKKYLTTDEKLTVSWEGITSAGLDRVQYHIAKCDDEGTVTDAEYVPWTNLKTTTASSGSASIDVSSYTNLKRYRIYIRGVDQCDNVGSSDYAKFYTDRSNPVIDSVTVSPATTSSDRTKDLTPTVSWKVTEKNFKNVKIYLGDTLLKTSTSKESSYTITSDAVAHGTNTIKVVALDSAGNEKTVTKTYYVDTQGATISALYTDPKATAWSSSTNDKTPVVYWETSATDLAKIQLLLDDVSIYAPTSTTVRNVSISSGRFPETKSYKFTLKLTDKAGNVTSKNVYYYVDLTKPVIESFGIVPDSGSVSMSNDTTPKIKWTVTEDNLSKIYYSLDGGAYKEAGSAATGSFTLPAITTDGTHKIKIKAVDKAGNEVVSSELTYYLDTTKPVFSSKSIDPQATSSAPKNNTQPKISWNITETNFDKVYYSINSTASADYVQMSTAKSGTFTIPKDKLTTTKSHTIRLKAADKAGNVSAVQSITYYLDVTKPVVSGVTTDPATSSVSLTKNLTPVISWTSSEAQPAKVEYQIDDKSYKQAGTAASGSFAIPAGEIGTSGVHTIRVRMTDKAGNVSEPFACEYHVDLTPPVFSILEISKSSFLIPSANRCPQISWNMEDNDLNHLSYSMDGTVYTEFSTASNGTFNLPDTVWGDKTSGSFDIYIKAVDNAGNETVKQLKYHLGEPEDGEFVPKNLKITEYYGKRILTWEIKAYDENVAAYELHRGTEEDFIASEETKLEENLNLPSLMYMDKEILDGDTYFYRIVVKDLNEDDETEAAGSIAAEYVNTVTEDQFSNRMGFRDYLSYLEIGLPTGTMNIEESSGNLVYDQSDYSFSAPGFSMDMDRVYNSKSGRTSMVGYGWTDSYHQEIYTRGDDLYFVDTDGSAYFFEKQEDGSFLCAETKAFTLTESETGYTITSKDNIVSSFNKNGQLTKQTEPNGHILENRYDSLGRLAEVKLSHGETEIRSLEFVYGENSYLLSSVTLPDNSIVKYSYNGNTLTNMEYGGITYRYGYNGSGKMNKVYDGEGNLYTVNYADGKVSEAAYPDGEKFVLTYNEDNTVIQKYTGDGEEFYEETTTFDPATGKILSHTDPEESTVNYNYGFSANPYLLTKSSEQVTYYTLEDGAEDVTESAETESVLSAFTYDGRENVTSETSEDGSVTTYVYDTENRVTGETTVRDGMTTSGSSYIYDERGNVTESADILTGQVTAYTLDGCGNVVMETLEENGILLSTTESVYDVYGNIESSTSVSGGVINISSFTYDSMGRTLTSSSPGTSTTYTYDTAGREIKSVTTEEGLADIVSLKTYDKNGTLLSESTSSGTSSEYSYDERNRVVAETVSGEDIASRTTSTSYGYTGTGDDQTYVEATMVTGAVSLFSSEAPSQTQVQYIDGAGKTLLEVDNQLQTEYTYDKSGNVLTAETTTAGGTMAVLTDMEIEVELPEATTPNQGSGGMSYNAEDSTLTLYNEYGEGEVQITEPDISLGENETAEYALSDDSLVTRQTFDGMGNVLTETNPEGITTSYSYDTQGRLTACDVNSDGILDMTASYSLTAEGNTVTTITDANRNKRKETVNAAGLLLETRDIASEEGTDDLYTRYSYDSQGRKIKEEYSDGTSIVYSYTGDYSSRVASEIAYLDSSCENAESEIIYTYDQYGRVSSTTVRKGGNTVSCTSWTYDAEGRKLSETVSDGISVGVTTEYVYDSLGRLAGVTYPVESGLGTVEYGYDANGNLSQVENSDGILHEYSYIDLGQLKYIRDYTSPKTETEISSYLQKNYTYDNNGRVTAIAVQNSSGETLERFDYTYDDNSQILSERHVNNMLSGDLNIMNIDETTSYIYDSFGRLTRSSKKDNKVNNAPAYVTDYGYDAVGNRISMDEDGTETTYTYNSLNQLVSSTEGNVTASYTYDGRGNQISETKGSITTESTYSVRGEMLTLTKKSGGTVLVSQENSYNHEGIRIAKKEDGITRRYYYDNGIVSYTKDGTTLSSANLTGPEGQVIGTFRGEEYHIYLKDIQGSTSSIVKDDGSLSAAYEYSDFGETEEITESSFDNEICYTGAVYDDTTGLYYMNARYYDPENGRFISQDTYRGALDTPLQWHLYAYCANNPVNYVDPSGHNPLAYILWSGMVGVYVITANYTTTSSFQKSWNSVTDDVLDGLNNVSNSAREQADALVRAIGKSFKKAKKRYNSTEEHHIVARKALRADPARKILVNKVGIGINEKCNLVTLKKGLHKRLHRGSYYNMVNKIIKNAYKKSGNKKRNVKDALKIIKNFLKDLNETSPF